jgi:hypothetical protein
MIWQSATSRPPMEMVEEDETTSARSSRCLSCSPTRVPATLGTGSFPAAAQRLCVTSAYAVPPPSALTCNSAMPVRIRTSAISRAATGIVPSVSPRLAIAGSPDKRPACCRWPIRTWSSPCRSNWHLLHSAISACSTTCCFAPPPRSCCKSPLIHAISAHASECSPCSIPGARTCATILTCIASYLPVDSPSTTPVGSPAEPPLPGQDAGLPQAGLQAG